MTIALIAAFLTLAAITIAVVYFARKKREGERGFAKASEELTKKINTIGDTSSPFQARDYTGVSASQSQDGPSVTDHLSSRFAAVGVLAAFVFGSLTAKLWSLQILSGDDYREESQRNLLTTIKTPAPRGRIYDAEGIELVSNKLVPTILADVDVAKDRNVMVRLSTLLGVPYSVIRQRVLDASGGAQAQRVVANHSTMREIAFISEHPDAFPGITIQERSHRVYPYGALAAHVLGYTGTASENDLANTPEGLDYQSGDEVGKSGVEEAYESMLAGAHGERVVVADVDGKVREVRSESAPTQGNDLYLTISARVQREAEEALKKMIAPEGAIGTGRGVAGACVALEIETGDVIAMANFPTFTPESFIGGISQDDWDKYTSEKSQNPLMNRCISGTYPAASTFKAFTGMAGLHFGFADSERVWDCTGSWDGFGDKYVQHCWELAGHGPTTFRQGIVVSCDIVFYSIAKDFYDARKDLGDVAMQDYIREFGIGRKTGIELSGEATGNVPTPEWKKEAFADAPEQAQWLPGDMTNMVIGQGDVLVTPIQIAVGYAGVATGRLPVPNLLKEIRNSAGDVVVTHEPEFATPPDVDQDDMEIMRDALRGVAEEDGAVPEILQRYNYTCGCKTGTGEAFSRNDNYAWFVLFAPYEDPRYVVSCLIEEGGAGVEAAAPVAARVMDACIKYGDGKLKTKVTPVVPIIEAINRPANPGGGSVGGRQE